MIVRVVIRWNAFHESVLLMRISETVGKLDGVDRAAVLMATDLNKDVLRGMDLATSDVDRAGANDLVIAVRARNEETLTAILDEIEELLKPGQPVSGAAHAVRTLDSALATMPEANLAVISVPGEFVKWEALRALQRGLHTFIFSSNVPAADERALKDLAHRTGLLVMGPDCGTAILNGVVIGFGNVVRRGPIGIVASSGTGIQQASVLIHRLGSGVSHAIGTGGRDLSEEIDAVTTVDGMRLLERDERTKVILLISKPPSVRVIERVISVARSSAKPVVLCLLGADPAAALQAGLMAAHTLEDAACQTVALATGGMPKSIDFTGPQPEISATIARECGGLAATQQFVRGIFAGGTLCYESLVVLRSLVGECYSNAPLAPAMTLSDSGRSREHTCLDMGAEEFVVGRPHPMIDPTLRKQRILQEGRDPETAVILLDVLTGYGSAADPAGALVAEITEARALAAHAGRYLPVVASIVGTELDPQDLAGQETKLKDAGVVLLPSNTQATRVAASIAGRSQI